MESEKDEVYKPTRTDGVAPPDIWQPTGGFFTSYQDPPAPDVKIAVRDANADAANAAESPAVMDDFDAKHSSWAQSVGAIGYLPNGDFITGM